jgi:hypothetical protein
MNYFLPVLEFAPFRTQIRVGDKVSFKDILSGGENPIYQINSGWDVIGYRHDHHLASRQELVVLKKGDRVINMHQRSVYR